MLRGESVRLAGGLLHRGMDVGPCGPTVLLRVPFAS